MPPERQCRPFILNRPKKSGLIPAITILFTQAAKACNIFRHALCFLYDHTHMAFIKKEELSPLGSVFPLGGYITVLFKRLTSLLIVV